MISCDTCKSLEVRVKLLERKFTVFNETTTERSAKSARNIVRQWLTTHKVVNIPVLYYETMPEGPSRRAYAQALHLMARQGEIVRLEGGTYAYPFVNELT